MMNNKLILILCFLIMLTTLSSSELFPTPSEDVMVGFVGDRTGNGVNIFIPQEILNTSTISVNISNFLNTNLGLVGDFNVSQFILSNNLLSIDVTFLENTTNGTFLRLDDGNQPTSNYNWITDLTTTGDISATNLSATALTDTGVVFVDTGGVLATEAGPFNWNKFGDFLELNELRMEDNNKIIMGNDISLEIFHSGTSAIISNTITGTFIFENLASGRGFDYFVGGYGGGFDPFMQVASNGAITWNPEGLSTPSYAFISSVGTAMLISTGTGEASFGSSNLVIGSDGRVRVDLDSSTGIRFGEAQDSSIGYNGTDQIYDSQLVGTGDHIFINGDVRIIDDLIVNNISSSGSTITRLSNAITGSNVDVSNLILKMIYPASTNGAATGLGFVVSASDSSVGAAIIHERVGSNSFGDLHFATKPSGAAISDDIPIRMTIDDQGRVGIGERAPIARLEVAGNVVIDGNADEVQLSVQGTSGQSADLIQVADFFGNELMSIGAVDVIFNEGGFDIDHRIEAQGVPNAFSLNGANGNIIAGGPIFTIGSGVSTVDYQLAFDGETNDGFIQFLEDEDALYTRDSLWIGSNNLLWSLDVMHNVTLVNGTSSSTDDLSQVNTARFILNSTTTSTTKFASPEAVYGAQFYDSDFDFEGDFMVGIHGDLLIEGSGNMGPTAIAGLWGSITYNGTGTSIDTLMGIRGENTVNTGSGIRIADFYAATPELNGGTTSHSYGMFLEDIDNTGATTATEVWQIYSRNGDWRIGDDNSEIFFGTGQDASINYDGFNMLISPKRVGGGIAIVEGGIQINEGANVLGDISTSGDLAVGNFLSQARLHITDDTRNPLADLNDPNDYQLVVQRHANNDGTGTGIGFTGTTATDSIGGAIIFTREAGNGMGAMNFYTKNNTVAGTDPQLNLIIESDGTIDISKDLNLAQTTASNIGVITMAGTAYIHSFGDVAGANIFIGEQSGNFVTTGIGRNIGIGWRSLEDVTSGLSNVGLGYLSFNKLTTGNHNFALGTQSANDLVSGDSNVLIGTFAGDELTTGDDNIMIGRSAGASTAFSSARNVYMGRATGTHISGTDTDNVDDNVAIGDDAMSDFSNTPSDNVAIGQGAGQLVGGSGNIFIGKDAGAQDNTNSNLLYIHNTNTIIPLIFGNFTSRELTINGDLIFTGNLTTSDGGVLNSNATCTFLHSPDGSTVLEVCNA